MAALAAMTLGEPAGAHELRLAQSTIVAPAPAGQPVLPETTPNSPRYETNGNAKDPAALVNPSVPAYQQGSGQETGGPARELIPRR